MGEIRIIGPGKTRGYPYPVCKKSISIDKSRSCAVGYEIAVMCSNPGAVEFFSHGKCDPIEHSLSLSFCPSSQYDFQ